MFLRHRLRMDGWTAVQSPSQSDSPMPAQPNPRQSKRSRPQTTPFLESVNETRTSAKPVIAVTEQLFRDWLRFVNRQLMSVEITMMLKKMRLFNFDARGVISLTSLNILENTTGFEEVFPAMSMVGMIPDPDDPRWKAMKPVKKKENKTVEALPLDPNDPELKSKQKMCNHSYGMWRTSSNKFHQINICKKCSLKWTAKVEKDVEKLNWIVKED